MRHKQAASNQLGVTQADIDEFFADDDAKPEPPAPKKPHDFDFTKPMTVWVSGGRTITYRSKT